MQLKSYLRGFGCGLFISAVLMGIAMSYSRNTMTDEEVKIRAAELGMVEEDSVLVRPSANDTSTPVVQLTPDTGNESNTVTDSSESGKKSVKDAGEKDADAGDKTGEKASGNEAVKEDETEEETKGTNAVKEDVKEQEKTGAEVVKEDTDKAKEEDSGESYENEDRLAAMGMNTQAPESDTGTDSKTGNENKTETKSGAKTETETKSDSGLKSGEATEEETKTNSTETYTLEISKGASSPGVAGLLKKSGLVDDAAAFDDYLCRNGYDKRIQNGVFKIPAGAGYEEIAKIITRSR